MYDSDDIKAVFLLGMLCGVLGIALLFMLIPTHHVNSAIEYITAVEKTGQCVNDGLDAFGKAEAESLLRFVLDRGLCSQ